MAFGFMVRTLRITLPALLLFCPQAAYAASPDGAFAAKGVGPQSCEVYVEEHAKESPAYGLFVGWVDGYVSHFNKVTPDTTDVFSWQKAELIEFLLLRFCRANPNTRFDVAVETLVSSLYPTRLRNVSEIIDIPGSEPPLQLYKDVVRRIQQTLTERGFYSGSIDGQFGPATSDAVEKFQASVKREETGLPDQVTLLLLFQ